MRHGARSEAVVRSRLRYVKQGVLQPLGLRQADWDPVARRLLDLYAHVLAKVELYDSWAAEHGWLDEDGNPPPFSREYYASVNSAGRLLAKLDEHLRRHQQAGPSPLQSHLPEHYPVR
jgi:hypothetical protein